MLRELKIGGGGFLLPAEEDRFRGMLRRHGKAFAFSPEEIGCVDPTVVEPMVVEPMVIFTVPHVPWNLKPIPVPRAHIPKLMELLRQKVDMGILEPSSAPYSNRWFTVPKKNGVVKKTVREGNQSTKACEPALHTHARQEVPKDELGTCEDRSG